MPQPEDIPKQTVKVTLCARCKIVLYAYAPLQRVGALGSIRVAGSCLIKLRQERLGLSTTFTQGYSRRRATEMKTGNQSEALS